MLSITLWLYCIMLDRSRMTRLSKCTNEWWWFRFVSDIRLHCVTIHKTSCWWKWLHTLESCWCLSIRMKNRLLSIFLTSIYLTCFRFYNLFAWKTLKVRLRKCCFFICRMHWTCSIFAYKNFIWRWFAQFLCRMISCKSCRKRLFSCFRN